jgi:ferrous iron transport protein B
LAGVTGIIIFIPQIAFLFLFMAVLEESGYMARVVFLMDRLMRPFGMNGRSVIPLIGGMACAIPSIMGARTIADRRERLVTILVTPLMSCSARIPVYTLLISMVIPPTLIFGFFQLQGLVMMGLYLLGFFMALLSALVLKSRIRKGERSIFLVELPAYRFPEFRNISLTLWHKCKAFVWEAGRVILVISMILWGMVNFGPQGEFNKIEEHYSQLRQLESADLEQLQREEAADKLKGSWAGKLGSKIEPLVKPLGFDWKIGIGLITSFAAREVFVGTMATLYAAEEDGSSETLRERMLQDTFSDTGKKVYTPATGISLILFYAFAMQCMSTLAITRRETGSWKWPIVMIVYMSLLAYLAALIPQLIVG